MKHSYIISEDKLVLKPMTYEDSQKYRIFRNKDSIRRWFVYKDIITEKEQNIWYKKYIASNNDCMFSIYYNGIFIGGNAIYNIDFVENKAEYGRLIINNEAMGGRGIGKKATRLACSIAKNRIGIKKLYLEVYADNISALKTYEYVGFSCVPEKSQKSRNIVYMEMLL